MANSLQMQKLITRKFCYELVNNGDIPPLLQYRAEFTVGIQGAPSTPPVPPGQLLIIAIGCDIIGTDAHQNEYTFAKVTYEAGSLFQWDGEDTEDNINHLVRTAGLDLLANAARGHLYTLCKSVGAPIDVLFPVINTGALVWTDSTPST